MENVSKTRAKDEIGYFEALTWQAQPLTLCPLALHPWSSGPWLAIVLERVLGSNLPIQWVCHPLFADEAPLDGKKLVFYERIFSHRGCHPPPTPHFSDVPAAPAGKLTLIHESITNPKAVLASRIEIQPQRKGA